MKLPHLPNLAKLPIFALLVAGVGVWVIVLLLLLEVSRQLLDILDFIVKLGGLE